MTKIGASIVAQARALLKADRAGEAQRLCAQRLDVDATNADVLHLLALAEHRLGNHGRAIAHMRQCLNLAPTVAALHSDLGRMLALEKQAQEAQDLFRRALTLKPEDSDIWHNLARCLRDDGRSHEAFTAATKALRLLPQRADTLVLLADILAEDQQLDKAVTCLEMACAAAPDDLDVRKEFARLLVKRGLLDRAEQAYRDAVRLKPDDADAWFSIGSVAEDRGDIVSAEQGYRRSIAIDPAQGFGIGRLLALMGDGADPELVAYASAALASPTVPREAKALVGYGLGKVHEARQDFAAAFDAYAAGNHARRCETGSFDRAGAVAQIDAIIATYPTAHAFGGGRGRGSDSELPVFVVGMPRSGTTLVEQILASHPLVHGAGELTGIAQAADALEGDASDLAMEARAYLSLLRRDMPATAVRAIDKSPLNFFKLGLIAALFPRARIIHCVRDPRDICLSIFAENFSPGQKYATDLCDLGFYWRQYRRLMAHWQVVLPLPMIEIVYERTVADVEATARSLCAFLDLAWDARCLDFHRNDRAVRTPSRWQVRKPIYTSSNGRWRRFESHLTPLLDELAMSESEWPAIPTGDGQRMRSS